MSEFQQPSEANSPDTLLIVRAYEAVKAPNVNPSGNPEDPRLQNRIDRFFEDVLSPLALNDLMRAELVVLDKARASAGDPEDTSSYDEYQTLSLRELQVLASTRTIVRSGVVYSVVTEKKELEAETIEALGGYQEGDTFLTRMLFRE